MKTLRKRDPARIRSRLSICSLLAVLLALATGGCGQSGPLYLPDTANTGKQSASEPAEQKEQGEEARKKEDDSEDEKTP